MALPVANTPDVYPNVTSGFAVTAPATFNFSFNAGATQNSSINSSGVTRPLSGQIYPRGNR